jgi:DNA-directed RNA polymerase, mitochondrial
VSNRRLDDFERTRRRIKQRNRRAARAGGLGAADDVVHLTRTHLKGLADYIANIRKVWRVPTKIRAIDDELLAATMIAVAVESIRCKAQSDEDKTFQWTALRISRELHGEAWRAAFEAANPRREVLQIERDAMSMWGTGRRKKPIFATVEERQEAVIYGAKVLLGFEMPEWSKATYLKVGAFAIRCLVESLPDVFVLDKRNHLTLTVCANADMDREILRQVRSNPLFLPLGEKPKDWTGPTGGGIFDPQWPPQNLIGRNHQGEIGEMTLAAVNSLQRTPFVINAPVLRLMRCMGSGLKDDRIVAESLSGAERLAQSSGRFWTPLRIDFRGRITPMSHFNFSREDTVRALFLFARGEPIGEEGIFWLKVHVANCSGGLDVHWGNVRLAEHSFGERVAWVDRHIAALAGIGRTALSLARGEGDLAALEGDLGKVKKKKRLQFVAACIELAQAIEVGPEFITRLPIAFDGSCSGFQHLCALMRDEDGGAHVNLVPDDRPHDLYGLVAGDVGIDRDLAKQPTMTHYYSVTPYGVRGQIIEELMDRWQDRETALATAKELAPRIRAAIAKQFPRPEAVKSFLRKLATVLADDGKVLRWRTPLGLEVENRYFDPKLQRVLLRWMHERPISKTLAVGDSTKVNKRKAANAATANFVHSLDAAHLMLVALAASSEGIDIVTVHDSFACLASRAGRFRRIIREQFVHLYRDYGDPLECVLDQARRDLSEEGRAKLPSLPKRGKLIIEDVLHAEYAWG